MKILIFGAVWCPGCLVMEKIWIEIKEKYPNIELINYDTEENDPIFYKHNIGDKIPVIIFVDQNNNEVERLTGEKTLKEIEEVITKHS